MAEARIARRVVDTASRLTQGRVGTGEIPHVETHVELVLLERFLQHKPDLIKQQFVAETVLAGLHTDSNPGPPDA